MARRITSLASLSLAALLLMGSLALPLSGFAAEPAAEKTPAKTDTKKPETQDISQAVVQSFNGDKAIQTGMIVKVDSNNKSSIQLADQKSANSLLGVTIAPNDAPVTITEVEKDMQQIFVATSGRYSALVTNQNGAIKAGDYVVVSSLAGLGMKADTEQPVILGTATSDFNGTSNVVGSVKLKDSTGKERSIAIGRVSVNLGIAKNPLKSDDISENVPSFLAKAAAAVANKPVSTARIYLGAITLFAATVVSGVVLYSGVRSGMIAVGRNPLSRKSIIKSLIQTVMAGLTIFIVGVFAVYLLLKL